MILYLPFRSDSPGRRNENSAHVENHCSIGAASKVRPSVGPLVPALDVFQEGCPPRPLETGGLETAPYTHGKAEARGARDPAPSAEVG